MNDGRQPGDREHQRIRFCQGSAEAAVRSWIQLKPSSSLVHTPQDIDFGAIWMPGTWSRLLAAEVIIAVCTILAWEVAALAQISYDTGQDTIIQWIVCRAGHPIH